MFVRWALWSHPGKIKLKHIATPFLSGLCYGPAHVGVSDSWTFVGQVPKWNELYYIAVSKRVVLWARPCGGLCPLDPRRLGPQVYCPPLFQPSPLARLLLYRPPCFWCGVPMVVLFYLSLVSRVACLFICLRGWTRLLLETLDIIVSHSFARTCIAMAVVCGQVLLIRFLGFLGLTSHTEIKITHVFCQIRKIAPKLFTNPSMVRA